jgi:hypothetical protein
MVPQGRRPDQVKWGIFYIVYHSSFCCGIGGRGRTRCSLPQLQRRNIFLTHPGRNRASPTKNTGTLQQCHHHRHHKQHRETGGHRHRLCRFPTAANIRDHGATRGTTSTEGGGARAPQHRRTPSTCGPSTPLCHSSSATAATERDRGARGTTSAGGGARGRPRRIAKAIC